MVTRKKIAHQTSATQGEEPPTPGAAFTVVCIGTSAGGLEALELFLRQVPPACGLAFVVIQHLDPTHKGALVELLQRTTAMPVMEIQDRMTVEPDHVYVIPPNRDLSILHGVLHLLEPTTPRGLRLPIDHFFRSLAADRQQHGISVIMSGMGSDGTLGLREALAVLQGRCREQDARLDAAKALESVLREEQAVLDLRITRLTRTDSQAGDAVLRAQG